MDKLQNTIFGRTVFDKRIYVFASAIVLLFAFDAVAIYFSWYFFYEWIDIPVHITGGFILSLLLYYVLYANTVTSHWFSLKRNKEQIFTGMVFWVLIVALSWEVVEFVWGRTVLSLKFPFDTFLDIVSTVTGALLGYLIIKELRIKK